MSEPPRRRRKASAAVEPAAPAAPAGEPANGVQRSLGQIEGALEEIKRRLGDADVSRKGIYATIDATRSDVAAVRSEVHRMSDRLALTEKSVGECVEAIDRFEQYEAGGKAAVSVVTFLGVRIGRAARWILATIAAALVAFWRELLDLVRG